MTRQYIGARYVPKFYEGSSGTDWTANTQYEPLTIVTRNGNSYTSKKPVPASVGAPESNPDYWASTGLYNSQVEQLRQDVAALSDDVETLSDDVETLDDLTSTKRPNDANRRYIFIGDSYNVGTSAEPSTGWGQHIKNILGLSNDRCYISAHGGSGFVASEYTFQAQINETIPTVNNPETISDVVIAGGYNDNAGTYESIVTAISNAVSTLKTAFPNARIYITMCGCSTRADGTLRERFPNIATFYRKAAGMSGAIYFDTWRTLKMLPDYMSTDEVHPNNTGYIRLAAEIINGINGGEISESDTNKTATLTPVNGITLAGGAKNWYMRVFNNRVNVFLPDALNTFNTAGAESKPTSTAFYKLGTFTNNIARGIGSTDSGSLLTCVPCSGYLMRGSNNQYVNFKGLLSINYNALWIMIREVENGTYMNMSDVNSITLDPAVLSFPIDFI